MRDLILNALLAHYEGQIKMAKANVEIFLENAVGVGEHHDILETMDIEIAKIADAEDKMDVVLKHLKIANPRI